MNDIVIRVENLSKMYRIGGQNGRSEYKTLRDTLTDSFVAPFRRASKLLRGQASGAAELDETIWALKDVSFEIKCGEAVGIIGRNGAGKSTLLKILSRITEPTLGYADICGRVGSLLEVGTGFHVELTGRENIYLNGAILGMKRGEIVCKFDEIVAFAEVEKFIDTPVKHYSTGMYLRLAFAVAAHLEPDILLIDEVLAVGDMAFQKKCLGKMDDVTKKGRTVIFVSHNMQAISQFCKSTILLNNGKIELQGPTSRVVKQYLSSGSDHSAEASWSIENAPGTKYAKLTSVKALNDKNEICYDMWMNKSIVLHAEFFILCKTRMTVSFHLYNQEGICLFATANLHDPVWSTAEYDPGLYSSSCVIPGHYLNEGQHFVKIYLTRDNNAEIIDVERPEVISFNVHDNNDTRGDFSGTWLGAVRPLLSWTMKQIGDSPSLEKNS